MKNLGGQGGFNLLEVMVALGILAFLMTAITSTQGSSLLHGTRVANLSTATQLVDGVIMNVEEEYRLDGFPDNSKEDEKCELPRGFQGFRCRYDLLALDVSSDNIAGLGESAVGSMQDSPLMSALFSGGANGTDLQADLGKVVADMGPNGGQSMGVLSVLADPTMTQLCGIDLTRMAARIPMVISFVPSIVEIAAKSTRKLRITISWDERGRTEKALVIETFITAPPNDDDQAP